MSFKIRWMKDEEFLILRDWMVSEGWNPGIYDYRTYHKINRRGFLIATLNDEIVGFLCTIQYGDNFAYAGWYLIKKEYRNHGFGWKLTW